MSVFKNFGRCFCHFVKDCEIKGGKSSDQNPDFIWIDLGNLRKLIGRIK